MDKKKLILITLPAVAVLVFLVIIMNNTGVVGNKTILSEIERLEILSSERNLKLDDFSNLEKMVDGDHFAEDHTGKARWLLEHNQSKHLVHTFGYLYNYIDTGKYKPCIPHEVHHAVLYKYYEDEKMVEHALEEINRTFDTWYYNSLEEYPGKENNARIDQTTIDTLNLIKMIHNNEIDDASLRKVEFVSGSGLC